ncbi:hypothetical protein JW930_03155 [Candidatus Woesearchaeota archaeon]|nr:hypothetical protein [Candidatus Woesearchaeota archaeon]
MKKRGQITIFIILGLILLFAAIFLIFKIASSKKQIIVEQQTANIEQLAPINNYVILCIEQVGKEALIRLGREGSLEPNAWIQTSSEKVAYFYYEGTDLFPHSIGIIERDVSNYINANLDGCLNDFASFDYPIYAKKSQLKATTTFNQDHVVIDVTYPITAMIEESEMTITDFNAQIPFNFIKIYEVAEDIIDETKKDEIFGPSFEFIFNLDPRPSVEIVTGTSTSIYIIEDLSQMIDNEPYVYRFAVKYDESRL